MTKITVILLIFFNIYFVLTIKIIKKRIIEKSFFISDSLNNNVINFILCYIVIYFLINKYPLIFCSFSIILNFLLRKCFIIFYYKYYNKYYNFFSELDYYVYRYYINPSYEIIIFYIILVFYIILIFYFFNWYYYFIFLLFSSCYKFYNFDRIFDEALFNKYDGCDIILTRLGLKKIKNYKIYILDPFNNIRKNNDCYFILGKDFIFSNPIDNEMYLKGYI